MCWVNKEEEIVATSQHCPSISGRCHISPISEPNGHVDLYCVLIQKSKSFEAFELWQTSSSMSELGWRLSSSRVVLELRFGHFPSISFVPNFDLELPILFDCCCFIDGCHIAHYLALIDVVYVLLLSCMGKYHT